MRIISGKGSEDFVGVLAETGLALLEKHMPEIAELDSMTSLNEKEWLLWTKAFVTGVSITIDEIHKGTLQFGAKIKIPEKED